MIVGRPDPGAVLLRCCECGHGLKPSPAARRLKMPRCVDCADRALLRSFGIDPDAARAAWARERERERRRESPDSDSLGPDDEGEPSPGARAAADVEQRPRPAEAPTRRAVLAAAADEHAAQRAGAYGAFFFLGIAGFMRAIVDAGWIPTALVALAAALIGGRAVLLARPPRE